MSSVRWWMLILRHLRFFSVRGDRLEEFDQVFYMDADTLVHRPFHEIWSYPVPLAAARDVRMGHGWLPSINAGTLLLKPNKRVLEHMLEIAPIYKYNTVFAEQGLLNGQHRFITACLFISLLKSAYVSA